MDAAILEKEAMRLPEPERALLADRLLESLSHTPPELESAWIREADARVEALREGQIQAKEGPEALRELRARLSK